MSKTQSTGQIYIRLLREPVMWIYAPSLSLSRHTARENELEFDEDFNVEPHDVGGR
jgi:hypothetical protein